VAQEELQQLVLFGSQRDGTLTAQGLARAGIQGQVGKAQDLRAGGLRPPQQSADARQQLVQVEGLHHIVIGAHIQTLNAVTDGIFGGQDQDRNGSTCAQAAGHFQAIDARQHEVQNHQVRRVVAGNGQTQLAVGGGIHLVAFISEPAAKEL
jgi:hypothetical protein